MTTEFKRMQQRAGTNVEWSAASTVVLLDGELGVETDTGRVKVGNGVTQYGALPYVGADQGVTFASASEVLTGLVNNKSVAPDTLAENYPRRAVGAVDSIINNNWAFNNQAIFNGITEVTLAPRAGATGVNDITNRAYIDSLFAGQTSGGSGDVNKAPILNSSGQLDSSYISSEALPRALGLFSPVTGTPTLQNVAGGGITPAANNGDYFIASASGFYNFDTGTPGGGTTVTQGAQIIFFDSTDTWSVVEPPGTSFDPGAVRKTPTNNSEVLILPGTDAVSNLTLQNRVGQTVDQLRFLDSGGAQLGGVTASGGLAGTSSILLFGASTSSVGIDYPAGLSHTYVTQVSGWPADGVLTTLKNSDSDVYQTLSNAAEFYVRRFTGTWSTWSEFATLFDPDFTGTPTSTTPPQGDDSSRIATTEFTTQMVNPIVVADSVVELAISSGINGVIFTSVNSDVNGIYNNTSGTATIPVGGAGIYNLQASVFVTNTNPGTSTFTLQVFVNSVDLRRIAQQTLVGAGNAFLEGNVSLILADSDVVQVVFENTSVNPVTFGFNGVETSLLNWMTLQRLGSVSTI